MRTWSSESDLEVDQIIRRRRHDGLIHLVRQKMMVSWMLQSTFPYLTVIDSDAVYEPYVALSYVWGLAENYTTVLSNIRIHQQQGSLEACLDKIPKVIRDAMDLVRRLGLRYLWVDSLCIVQNSNRSWTLNARMMNVSADSSKHVSRVCYPTHPGVKC